MAQALRTELVELTVKAHGYQSLEKAFKDAINKRVKALLISNCPEALPPRETVDLAARNRLPAMYALWEYVVVFNGLMFYGPIPSEQSRRAAYFVDKILKGAKPSDLPVEQPTKFELVINLKTAKELGLTIPTKVLMWADKVIE